MRRPPPVQSGRSDRRHRRRAPPADRVAPPKATGVTTTLTDKGVIITPAGGTPPADAVGQARAERQGAARLHHRRHRTARRDSAGRAAQRHDAARVARFDRDDRRRRPLRRPPCRPCRSRRAARCAQAAAANLGEPVVIVDENRVTPPQNLVGPPAPPVATPNRPVPPAPIADDAANWRGNGLEQYLDRNGLLDNGRSNASVTVVDRSSDYDPDGFYLSDGPNCPRARAGPASSSCSTKPMTVTTCREASACFDPSAGREYSSRRANGAWSMASVWQRLGEIVGSANERTGVVGSLVNLLDPDNWLPGGQDAAFTLALIALSAKMAVADGVVTASELRAFKRTVEIPAGHRGSRSIASSTSPSRTSPATRPMRAKIAPLLRREPRHARARARRAVLHRLGRRHDPRGRARLPQACQRHLRLRRCALRADRGAARRCSTAASIPISCSA